MKFDNNTCFLQINKKNSWPSLTLLTKSSQFFLKIMPCKFFNLVCIFFSNVCTKLYSVLIHILKCNVHKLDNLLNLRMDGILCRVCNIFNVMDHAFVRESFLF
jgi:hypothetical protein